MVNQLSNILITSMPKAGTHLLAEIVSAIYGKKSLPLSKSRMGALPAVERVIDELDCREFIFHGHLRHHHYSCQFKSRHWKFLVLVRDPRDILISMHDFMQRSPHPDHAYAFSTLVLLPYRERLKRLMNGIDIGGYEIARMESYCRGWLEWQKRGALLLRYEDLRSPESAVKLAGFLDVPLETVEQAVCVAYGRKTRTLSEGSIGRWQKVFDEDLVLYTQAHDGGVIANLGYDWVRDPNLAVLESLPGSSSINGRMKHQGKIVQIIGAVVDVEFARTEVPKIYDALKV
ncbi:MAG: sulfotransferase domain-containing protein, partial [Bradyrhizobium sp.]